MSPYRAPTPRERQVETTRRRLVHRALWPVAFVCAVVCPFVVVSAHLAAQSYRLTATSNPWMHWLYTAGTWMAISEAAAFVALIAYAVWKAWPHMWRTERTTRTVVE